MCDVPGGQAQARPGHGGAERGAVSVVTGSAMRAKAVLRDERSGLDLLIAETARVTPVDFLESDQSAEFSGAKPTECDRVVFDAPPERAMPHARILARCADALIHALKCNPTARRMTISGLGLLRQVNAALTGSR